MILYTLKTLSIKVRFFDTANEFKVGSYLELLNI